MRIWLRRYAFRAVGSVYLGYWLLHLGFEWGSGGLATPEWLLFIGCGLLYLLALASRMRAARPEAPTAETVVLAPVARTFPPAIYYPRVRATATVERDTDPRVVPGADAAFAYLRGLYARYEPTGRRPEDEPTNGRGFPPVGGMEWGCR